MAQREHWGSKIGFILAAAGSAVGLGNIWKFPYETGSQGGAAFVLIYIACILVLGLPIMFAELVVGRHTEKDPVGAFKEMVGDSKWRFVGFLGVASGFIILSFYSVVGGWTISYIIKAFSGDLATLTSKAATKKTFGALISHPGKSILYHFIFMATCVLIVSRGINKGIERWSKILMPLIFVLLIILIIKGMSMEGSSAGIKFLFYPDFSKITYKTVLSALGHSFFTLSLGMGAMITYGSYLSRNDSILASGTYIVILDTIIALLAGMAIFPALFAMGFQATESGPGLIFNIIPLIFAKMSYGTVFAVLFFVLLFVAALTSGMSLLEVVITYIIDEKGWKRSHAVVVFGLIIFIIGIPSALSFGILGNVKIIGLSFFDIIEKTASNYMLPLGGLLISICLGWKYGLEKLVHELDVDTRITFVKKAWGVTLKYVSPVVMLIFFGNYLFVTIIKLFK